ncbi:MAG: CDP-archaeol synthase [Gammaproteobacteria bacterium]
MTDEIVLLFLLLTANGTPVIAHYFLGKRFAYPVDGGKLFIDNEPLFGNSKTIRGILVSLFSTGVIAPLLHIDAIHGLAIGATAMLGDLASSFTKRRMKRAPSSMALGLDQIPESLLPVLFMKPVLGFSWLSVVFLVIAFFILELLLSRILFELRVRKKPY